MIDGNIGQLVMFTPYDHLGMVVSTKRIDEINIEYRVQWLWQSSGLNDFNPHTVFYNSEYQQIRKNYLQFKSKL